MALRDGQQNDQQAQPPSTPDHHIEGTSMTTPQPTPPPTRVSLPIVVWLAVAAGFLGMTIGVLIGSFWGTTEVASPAPAPTVTQKVPVPGPTVTKAVPGPTKTVTVSPQDAPTDISDGSYIVGDDIKPGRYRTVHGAKELCYADVTEGEDVVLAQETSEKGGKTVIDVPDKPGALFTSSGCGDWERVKR